MKILVLAHRSNFSGGANRSLLAVVKGLKDKGHQIDVVLPRKTGELNDALTNEKINWWYCKYYRMGAKAFVGPLKIASYLILYSKYIHHFIKGFEIYNKVKNDNYDVIYTNTILPYCGLFAAKRLNVPSVIHDRESLDGSAVLHVRNYEKFLYDHADKIIVISSDLNEQWKKRNFEKNIVLIRNGIPMQEEIAATQEINGTFNILLTARISKMKHHLDALEALKKLMDRGFKNIKLYFAGSEGEKGDSEYKNQLVSYIAENSLQDDVVFLGEVKNMGSLRSSMNVELMCNPNEPFGRVTVEGMRSGLVVIGVRAGGTVDIINDGVNGLLYEKNNIDDLVEKLIMVYCNSQLRKELSERAFEYGTTHFTMEENVDEIEKVLYEVVENKKSC